MNTLNYFFNVNMKARIVRPRPREIVVNQEQDNAEGQKGSSLMQGIRDRRNNIEQFRFQNKSNVVRLSGSSINNPVHFASAAPKVGNPIATSEESANQSSRFDLSQSGSGQQSLENDKGSQQIQGTYRSPVPVSDDSDPKNLEMEASALREDMANQAIEIFRTVYQTKIIDVLRIRNTILPYWTIFVIVKEEYYSYRFDIILETYLLI